MWPWAPPVTAVKLRDIDTCTAGSSRGQTGRGAVGALLPLPHPAPARRLQRSGPFCGREAWERAQTQTLKRLAEKEKALGGFSDAFFFNDDLVFTN